MDGATEKLELGLQRLAKAGDDADMLGLALQSIHGALEDHFRARLSADSRHAGRAARGHGRPETDPVARSAGRNAAVWRSERTQPRADLAHQRAAYQGGARWALHRQPRRPGALRCAGPLAVWLPRPDAKPAAEPRQRSGCLSYALRPKSHPPRRRARRIIRITQHAAPSAPVGACAARARRRSRWPGWPAGAGAATWPSRFCCAAPPPRTARQSRRPPRPTRSLQRRPPRHLPPRRPPICHRRRCRALPPSRRKMA